MANTFFKTLAMTLGAGLAVGIGSKLGRRSTRRRGGILDLAPIADRLDYIEERIGKVESTFGASKSRNFGPAGFESRLATHAEDMQLVRREIRSVNSRSAEQLTVFHEKLAAVETRLPQIIETTVEDRIGALERKLQTSFRETQDRTFDMLVQTIETKIVGRIATLERNMSEQSGAIASLREKSMKTDENLQRLLAAVEKLCAQTAAQASVAPAPALVPEPAPAPAPMLVVQETAAEPQVASFASHLARQLGREHVVMPPPSEPKRTLVPIAFSLIAVSLGLMRITR